MTGGAIPPAPAYVDGRFSNGSVWVEYLAERLDLVGKLENYSFGGACSGRESYVSFAYGIPGLPGLQDELDLFAAARGGRADPRALYIVQAGANDIFLWAESGMNTSLADFAALTASNIADAVARLRQMGARNILVVDVADIGLTPYGLASGFDTMLTGVTMTVNNAVAAKLRKTKHREGPELGYSACSARFARSWWNPRCLVLLMLRTLTWRSKFAIPTRFCFGMEFIPQPWDTRC